MLSDSNKSRECLTAMEQVNTKENHQEPETDKLMNEIECRENDAEESGQDFSREDWEQSNIGFVANFPEF